MTVVDTPAPARVEPTPPISARIPRWALPALLGATAVLYLWRLGDSGWANAYYSAAAQAGSQSWAAWFFGSTDSANSITVDKTPAALWFMGLSARIFGVSAWSILVPQALMGVASVGMLYATVKRTSGAAAGLIAGAVLALTPVAVLIFRFNNPDALLVLLLVVGAYCTVRAVEKAGPGWLALAGAAVGFAFLAKMLQAFLVLPAFGLAYLVFARTSWPRRALHLAGALGAMIVAGGWWVAVVELIPAGSRPYIGGSQTNSVLELALGYNGLGRLTGNEVGSVGGGGRGNTTGLSRLLGDQMGSQIAWLLPAALVLLIAGWWAARGAARVGLLLWGGWLVVTAVVFSYMNGIIHPYYTVALAPAIGAVVGIGAAALWQRRTDPIALAGLSGAVALAGGQAYLLLKSWSSPLAIAVLVLALAAAAGFFFSPRVFVPIALVAALIGPATYSVITAATPHSGAIPSAGPAGGFRGGGGGVQGGRTPGGAAPGGGVQGGGFSGLLSAPTPGPALVTLLQNAATKWAAAAVNSNNAAGYQLGSGKPVMAVGGFNGTDPAPTLAEFQQLVADGQIHYFLGGAGMAGSTGSDASQKIAAWVAQTFKATTVDGVVVYDLTVSAQQ
jgi:4-amino-4-deoxy-L-arabinose transferase-like glycosyltransferase